MWFLCGALFGFGLVGFLTGLLLIPFAIALFVYLWNRRVPGWWLALVGAGSGPVVLFWGDVFGYPDGGCKSVSGGYICRASGAVPGFITGLVLVASGVLLGALRLFIAGRWRPGRTV